MDGLLGKLKLAIVGLPWLLDCLSLVRTGDILMARGPDSIGFLGWFCILPTFRVLPSTLTSGKIFLENRLNIACKKCLTRTPNIGLLEINHLQYFGIGLRMILESKILVMWRILHLHCL